MHALKDNLKLMHEVEQLSKITEEKDERVKKLVNENEQAKKLTKEKDEQVKKLIEENEKQKKEIEFLKEALDMQAFTG